MKGDILAEAPGEGLAGPSACSPSPREVGLRCKHTKHVWIISELEEKKRSFEESMEDRCRGTLRVAPPLT